MLLSYYGKQTAPVVACSKHAGINKLRNNPRRSLKGSGERDSLNLFAEAGLNGYSLYVSPANKFLSYHIEGVLASFAPFIASVKTSPFSTHALLFFGIEGDKLFYHDPWKGANMSMTLARLNDITTCLSLTTATLHPVDAASARQFGMSVDTEV
jgi:hypothetical protein